MVVKNNYEGKQGACKSCSGRPDDHTLQRGMVVHGHERPGPDFLKAAANLTLAADNISNSPAMRAAALVTRTVMVFRTTRHGLMPQGCRQEEGI